MLAHVLHVEDQPAVAALVRLELNQANLGVITVGTGAEALALAQEIRFDLILLDDGLPDIPGLLLCQRLKADPLTQPVPVLFLSGDPDPQRHIQATQSGAVGWLRKGELKAPLAERILAEVKLNRERHPRHWDWPPRQANSSTPHDA